MLADALCQDAPVHWGSWAREQRRARGWTMVEAARRINASEGTVRKLERASTPPVGSEFAPLLTALYANGPDVDDAINPRLFSASKLQLVDQLARVIAEEEGGREKHDQSNVSPAQYRFRGVPTDAPSEDEDSPHDDGTHSGDVASLIHPPFGDERNATDPNGPA